MTVRKSTMFPRPQLGRRGALGGVLAAALAGAAARAQPAGGPASLPRIDVHAHYLARASERDGVLS